MQVIDWLIIAGLLLFMAAIALVTQRLNRSVADFLAANRCAGRYLLTMADGMAGLGAITIAANFEKFYEAGFGGLWWSNILAPLGLLLALTGFVIYRYRETRVLTMAQFFERRYGRRFRIYAGFLAFLSGILNYGIFPAVTSRFLVYFTGLPVSFDLAGLSVPTEPLVMAILLSMALVITLSGGQIAVMVTDFFQGQIVNIAVLIVLGFLATKISWGQVFEGLAVTTAGQSKINPFDQGNLPDFNPLFFLMLAALQVYGFKAWQGAQGYNASAKTPHEAKMAGILAGFRGLVTSLLVLLLPIYVYAAMHLDAFADMQTNVNASLAMLGDDQLVKQMRVPTALGQLLPVGLMGLFASVIIMSAVSTDDTYLHSWGSIFIQDVVMPLRKKPLCKRTHMRLLRGSIFGVAVFAFVFSLVFPLKEYILMWFQITGAIFLGGAGAAILGGLYWKRGTVEGAWAAMIIGPIMAVTGILSRNIIWPSFIEPWHAQDPDARLWAYIPVEFPLNGVQMSFAIAGICAAAYVFFSLLSKRPPIDMDRLLNRGRYAVESGGHHPMIPADATQLLGHDHAPPTPPLSQRLWRRLGVGPDFTRGDKLIYILKIMLFLVFFVVFVVVTAMHYGSQALLGESIITDGFFRGWWAFRTIFIAALGVIAVVWFLIGGFRDLFERFRTLRSARRDDEDNGSVCEEDHLQTETRT